MVVDEATRNKVIGALGNPKYKWRTVQGVAKETGIEPEIVESVIENDVDEVIRSSFPGPNQEELFTTRANYEKKASFVERFRSFFTNRLG
ncbi:MAG: hypothetical protein WC647_16180 [Desulfomonilaceae bacterium]|jgi:hypothetical protein